MSDFGAERLAPPSPVMSELRRFQIQRIFDKLPTNFSFTSRGLDVTIDSSMMGAHNVDINHKDALGNRTSYQITAVYDDTYRSFIGVSARKAGYRAGSESPLWQEGFSSFSRSGNELRPREIVKSLRTVKRLAKKHAKTN